MSRVLLSVRLRTLVLMVSFLLWEQKRYVIVQLGLVGPLMHLTRTVAVEVGSLRLVFTYIGSC